MRELEFQSFIVKTAKAHGGHGFKMSNRFLVGVPDLLVQIPGCHTLLLEAKFDRITKIGGPYTIQLTPRQAYTLRQMGDAGMVAGAVSLLVSGTHYGVRFEPIAAFEGEDHLRLDTKTYSWGTRKQLSAIVDSGLRALAGNRSVRGKATNR